MSGKNQVIFQLTCSSASWYGSTNTWAFTKIISSIGLSLLSTSILSISDIVSIPPTTRPKIVCLLSKCLQERYVIKLKKKSLRNVFLKTNTRTYNCEPLVFFPEFAMERTPRPVWDKFGRISSLNLSPQIDWPPRPVFVGSPPWI